MKKILHREDGLIYLGTVLLIMVILGVMAFSMANLLVISNGKTANLYSDTQAELAANTGVEYAFYKLMNDFANWTGTADTVAFGKSSFTVTVYTTDEDGGALAADERRVVSTGITEQSVKQVQVNFSSSGETSNFAVFVDELEDPVKNNAVSFSNNNTLKGDMFFNTSVEVKVPRADIDSTTVYVPSGYTVTSDDDFDDTYSWAVYPPPLPTFPDFDTSVHDSLLFIADTITVTDTSGTGNRFYGNFLINDAFTLDDFTDNTLFINGNLTIQGANAIIDSLTTANPGYLVVNGTVDIKNGCYVEDNIITIASGNLGVTSPGTMYGKDYSSFPINQRPTRVNELFSRTNVGISGGTVFAAVESLGDLSLRGTIYSTTYCAGTVTIESSIFQGSVVTKSVKLDRISNCTLEFVLPLAVVATGGIKPSIVPGSWKLL